VAACRLVGRDRDAVATGLETLDGALGIRVQVVGAERAVSVFEGRLLVAPFGLLEHLEEAAPILGPLGVRDRATEHRHDGELGQAEDLGPGPEDACLVDQRLSDVEAHPSVRHEFDGSGARSLRRS
jgi:hypothetical protein